MPKAHLAAIGTYLTHVAGIPAAKGIWSGYRTDTTDQPGQITVHWVLGADVTAADHTTRQQIARDHLQRIKRALETRYTVTERESPELGWGGIYLRVQEDPLSDLTPLMRAAYGQIRQGGENYRYGPLTPSVNRAKSVTPKDLRPVISGGLQWRQVAALERRGLVKLVPTTEKYGKVLAVPQEDTDEQ